MSSTGDSGTSAHATITDLLRAAEPTAAKPLDGLVTRLRGVGERVSAEGMAGTEVRGVTADSRAVVPGGLFIAIPGATADGHQFAADAVRAGAAALVVEHRIAGVTIPQIVVAHTRPVLAEAAAWWYGDPSRELRVIGITGTDGKTSTGLLAAAALTSSGIATGLVGTVATQIGGRRETNVEHATTPEAPALQLALRAMVQAGDQAAILETTSHALVMDRVRAVTYAVAIFTNLSHEHLELHGTFENYRAAKRRLFEGLAVDGHAPFGVGPAWPRVGIVNLDDPSASTFADATIEAGARLVTFGAEESADIRLVTVREERGGLGVDYSLAGSPRHVRLQLAGRFNAHNALAVVGLGWALDLDPGAVEAGLAGLAVVPGRMEHVARGQPFDVVIDYAHSPASLALVLDELGPVAAASGGGLIAVFGSAGERDVEKRSLMGRVAASRCRHIVVTDEDPRGEEPAAIVAQIAAAARSRAGPGLEGVAEIPDRRAAIEAAFQLARPGDVVVLAGKGHEASILYADGPRPWSERSAAEAALAALGWAD